MRERYGRMPVILLPEAGGNRVLAAAGLVLKVIHGASLSVLSICPYLLMGMADGDCGGTAECQHPIPRPDLHPVRCGGPTCHYFAML